MSDQEQTFPFVQPEPPTPEPPQPLFDENDRYTGEANKLDREATEALKDLIARWAATHSVRDIEYIVQHTVGDLCLDQLLADREKKAI